LAESSKEGCGSKKGCFGNDDIDGSLFILKMETADSSEILVLI
jgi:hypothetical protein